MQSISSMHARTTTAIGIIAVIVLASGSFVFTSRLAEAQTQDNSPQTQGTQQQIINNYQCFGGGDNSVTICIFNSVNINLACNDTVNAAKNLSLLSHLFRLHPDARLLNINQQQWQQIVNNYQCFGGGNNSVTICNFNSTNINVAANKQGLLGGGGAAGANRELLSDFFRMHPDAKRLQNAPIRTQAQAPGAWSAWNTPAQRLARAATAYHYSPATAYSSR